MKKTANRVARAVRAETAKTLVRELAAMGFAHTSGQQMTHTQALDLLAKLENYNSHGHKSSVSKKKKGNTPQVVTPLASAAVEVVTGITAEAVAQEWLANGGVSKRFPLADWQYEVDNGGTKRSYAQWLLSQHFVHRADIENLRNLSPEGEAAKEFYCQLSELDFEGRVFMSAAREIQVLNEQGMDATWKLEPNLSCRWGELNDDSFEKKPGFVQCLLEDFDAIDKLENCMAEESTFIAQCDGKLGLLLEYELYTRESAEVNQDKDAPSIKTEAETLAHYAKVLQQVKPSESFPWARFAIAKADSYSVCDNMVLMAFVSLEDMRKHSLTRDDIQKAVRMQWTLSETKLA